MNNFLIFPNTLYDIKYLNKELTYYIYEHPDFFTKYNFNKKKLILHRASMVYYYDLLKKNKFKVKYIEFNNKLPKLNYTYFDPINKIDIKDCIMIESPNFLLTKKQYNQYRNKTDKFKFNNFYMWSKKELQLYPELKSKDTQNRKVFKNNIIIPKLSNINKEDLFYINDAIKYINKYFSNNYGNTDNFHYPITHNTAYNWLIDFLNIKLKNFGNYQDYVNKNNNYMFHSILSSSINIGLINPNEIIDILKQYYNKVDINNFEGFLRQLFWREYQRYCYLYINFTKYNYFNNNKLLDKKWYNGTLGIKPIDDLIKSGFDTGYIHHIGRLMFIGNFMMLNNIHPKEGFNWFMEFSIDSYEWIMYQNVYDMVFFCTGGLTMRKPYISSSNYILKMSNYEKNDWVKIWDNLFYDFLKNNKEKMYKFRYYYPIIKKI